MAFANEQTLKMNLREVPLLRAVIPMIIGIATSLLSNIYLPFSLLLPLLLLLTTCTIFLGFVKIPFSLRWFYGVGLMLFWWMMGFTLTQFHHEKNAPDHFSQFVSNENWVKGKIFDRLKIGKREYWVIKINLISDSTDIHQVSGRLLVKVSKDRTTVAPEIGDKLITQGEITPIQAPLNPSSFDFKQFMHQKNIHFILKTNSSIHFEPSSSRAFLLLTWAKIQQTNLTTTLKKYLPEQNAFAVSAALAIGNKEHLTPGLKKAYANTGAMHVLAVSGLHVGLIYLLLNYIFGQFPRFQSSGNWIKLLLLLMGIWTYALITGLSASVVRASILFSILGIGKTTHKQANIYNVISAAALIMLCINPFQIMDIGFQLSFTAVLGIIYFQPKIYHLFYIKPLLLDHTWKLLSLALAAQLATFPLGVYYFHQFPVYFWVTGLFVVPAASIILIASLFLPVLDLFPSIAIITGNLLNTFITFINKLIFKISQWPLSIIEEIWIDWVDLICLGFIFIAFICWLEKVYRLWLPCLAIGCIGMGIWNLQKNWTALTQEKLTLYHDYKSLTLDLIVGQQCFNVSDSTTKTPFIALSQSTVRNSSRVKGPISTLTPTQERKHSFFYWNQGFLKLEGFTLAIFHPQFNHEVPSAFPKVDYILLSQNTAIDLEELLKKNPPEMVIIGANNYPYLVEKWTSICRAYQVEVFNQKTSGAFQFKN